jgi:hypothetical protein
MDFRVVPAGRGLAWFQQAIRALDANPRRLIQIASVYVLIQLMPNLLANIPELKLAVSAALLVLGPALSAGLMYAVSEAHAGRAVSVGQLFEGLRRPGARTQLLVLGMIWLVAALGMAYCFQHILGTGAAQVMLDLADQKIKPDSPAVQALAVPMLKGMLAVMAILFVLLIGLFFAVPRVMFDGRNALASVAESFAACASNIVPMLVYALLLMAAAFAATVGLAIVAGILGLLGQIGALLLAAVFLIVAMFALLIGASGNYQAWHEVFGRTDDSATPPQAEILA